MYSVLIVDDEAVQREYLAMQIPALDSRFAIAGEAADGREALDFLRTRQVDLLVTDIKMPVMNGLELCREAYGLDPRIKIVILSGYEEFEYAREALKYKAEQYLLKPLNREALRLALSGVASRLEAERAEEWTLRGLRAVSRDGMTHIGRRLLQALIAGSEAEIGSLFPLACKMKIPLFEGEGVLLLLSIDEASLRDRKIPTHDRPVFQYILNQIAAEVCEPNELAWPLFDERGRTAVLLSGTEANGLPDEARSLFAALAGQMNNATGLTITGGLGNRIEDVLQVESSYQTALSAICRRYCEGGNRLYESGTEEDEAERAEIVFRYARGVRLEPDGDGAVRSLPVPAGILPAEEPFPVSFAYELGAYLLLELERGPTARSSEAWRRAWETLHDALPPDAAATSASAAEAYRLALLALQPSDNAQDKPSDAGERHLAEDIRRFIERHYAEPVSLAMLSDRFHASPQHISTAFHQHVGIPYIKYMTHVRLDHAARLLSLHPGMKLSEIAEKTGYASVKHFSYVFKKHFGRTPGEYRPDSH
ncbi:response regulator [Paenibacillaceae bacterium WGS1546]|uniref:response regulator n=1 Tax=Cohnella sp. WGS1546 TaxID=3366810 RepID=UPI00372CF015